MPRRRKEVDPDWLRVCGIELEQAQKAVNEALGAQRAAAHKRRLAIAHARQMGLTWDHIARALNVLRGAALAAAVGYEKGKARCTFWTNNSECGGPVELRCRAHRGMKSV